MSSCIQVSKPTEEATPDDPGDEAGEASEHEANTEQPTTVLRIIIIQCSQISVINISNNKSLNNACS